LLSELEDDKTQLEQQLLLLEYIQLEQEEDDRLLEDQLELLSEYQLEQDELLELKE